MRLVEFGCGPWAALGNKPRNEPTEFGEALTRKRQAPRKCLRQKPLNRGVTSQAASHHAWFRFRGSEGTRIATETDRLAPLASSASVHERIVNRWAAASGGERIDLSAGIAWFDE